MSIVTSVVTKGWVALGFACRPNKAVATDQGLGALLKLDAAGVIAIKQVVVCVVMPPVNPTIHRVTAKANATAAMTIRGIKAKGVTIATRNETA